tara:strand:- start:1108 stop:1266 length:159 start_codon:yes stop_codon:yes gene_type:complete
MKKVKFFVDSTTGKLELKINEFIEGGKLELVDIKFSIKETGLMVCVLIYKEN